ncbi:hypothetical protein [Streptomyces sp. JW3]|uniref:hypothetical protein n=1 Tax=Streptomyces sp. JW3 TaxID=3456955 RepID=UPI003FA42564
MTALQELTHEFGDAAVASAIIESLHDHGLKVLSDTIEGRSRGFSGAQLVKAQIADASNLHRPRWCVIKYCPSAPSRHQRETRRHWAALQEASAEFRQDHLTDIAFPTVPCPQDGYVVGQFMAGGVPLGNVELNRLADCCETVWYTLLHRWTGDAYGSRPTTVAELLMSELGDAFGTDGWLRDWARSRGLLAADLLQLPGESEPLPNPWRLFTGDPPAALDRIHCLVGRAHGDLHGDNVLIPKRNGVPDPSRFRLIDLATYDGQAPLSRDLATLLISLCWRQIGESSTDSQSTFLTYLEHDERDEELGEGIPPRVRKIIDALREPTLRFVVDKHGDTDHWHRQLKISLLAQAMLHSAYENGTPDARRWCARLAGRLTRLLLGSAHTWAAGSTAFDAGEEPGRAGMVPTRTIGRLARGGSAFVDRTGPRGVLRAALDDRVTAVIVVSGPAGIGKTALVREVLMGLSRVDPDDETAALHWHDATPYGDIDVATLVQAIEPPGLSQAAGPYARARLEMALDSHRASGGLWPVVVIDSAENLLDDDHTLRDSELDLALDTVRNRPHPVIKVVLVTQHVPKATTGVAWPETAVHISLEGLEPLSLKEYFAALDPRGTYGLAVLPDDDLRRVHGRLAGNPRLAELLSAVTSSGSTGLQTHEVGSWLSLVPENEVHHRLVLKFIDHLPVEQQRVVEALAALGIPADTQLVTRVVESSVPAPRVEPVLRTLVAVRLVLECRDGRRYVRKSEIDAVLSRLADGERRMEQGGAPPRRSLLLEAVAALQERQKDEADIHGLGDLEAHFARVDVWLRAGLYDYAHSLIESMNALVCRWSSGVELRAQREAVRGRLSEEQAEMVNLAGLGNVYSFDGDFASARSAYESALTMAQKEQDREAIRAIHIGMGVMFGEHGHVAEAERHYGWAWALACEDDDEIDRAAALTGLAVCRQRRGDYWQAIADARSAFMAAYDSDAEAAFGAALRLVRWYAELNEIRYARAMLDRCDELVTAHPDPSKQADLLCVKAELYLWQDKYGEARGTAEQAISVARDYRYPVTLRRSLTVLATAHVHMSDLPAARKAIEEAARYRVAGKETVELALRAIVAHRSGRPGTAADLFQQLHDETGWRTGADASDLMAWDFTGIARCYSVLIGQEEPSTALEAFKRARPEHAAQTPGLDDRLRFLVEMLANGDPRLEPVLRELARMRPGRTG